MGIERAVMRMQVPLGPRLKLKKKKRNYVICTKLSYSKKLYMHVKYIIENQIKNTYSGKFKIKIPNCMRPIYLVACNNT